ncbi:MAG: phosphonate ABC transporter ATP-binding protein, partial [Planctomycetota bacterium]
GRELRALRSSIAFVHQDLSLVPTLRVSQNVIAGKLGRWSWLGSLRAMLFPSRKELARAHEILERVGIPEKLFERTDRVSGGQRQRVAVARALYQDPQALLADEPVSSVDPARARDLVELLTKISMEEELTLCMSLHNLDLAREYFPRLVGMRAGRVVFDRPTEEIGAPDFHALYDLTSEELLADGA